MRGATGDDDAIFIQNPGPSGVDSPGFNQGQSRRADAFLHK